MLKVVTVHLSIFHDKINDFLRRVRYLDGIRLDVGDREATLPDFVFQVYHEQRPALGDNVVYVPNITEGIVEFCRCQTVHRIDCDFQGFGEVGRNRFVVQILCQSTAQHGSRLGKILVLDGDTSVKNILEALGVFLSEQLLRHD